MLRRIRSYSDLPEEIVFDILSRVPAKSVGLCRCVSKPWRTLLCQPNFIKTHLKMSKVESLAVVRRDNHHGTVFYSTPLNNAHDKFTLSLTKLISFCGKFTLSLTKLSFVGDNPVSILRIYGSCDGLLLVADWYNMMAVMNPVTREIKQVPPRDSNYYTCGFGYDSVTDDYKIVINSYFLYYHQETFVGVYSLKTGSWKRLESPPYYFVAAPTSRGVFLGGWLHWLARRNKDNKKVIVAFNLAEEKFLEIPPPDLILDIFHVEFSFPYTLGVLAGCLCLYSVESNMVVWIMKTYGVHKSWTKLMNNPYFKVECFLNHQEHQEQVVMRRIGTDDYVMWNPKQGTSKEILFDGFNTNSIWVEASFVESLVSPHGTTHSERD